MLRALTSVAFALGVVTADARGQVAPQDSADARLVPGARVRVSAVLAIPSLAAAGGLIGHRIGRAFKSERWEPAAPEPVRVGFTWLEGPGVALSVGL